MPKDYYKILGVEKNATADEIKKAYRRLAHEHHPDKGGDEATFKNLNEAYQVLGDQKKRTQYDQFGSAAFENGGMGNGAGGWGQGFPGGGFQVNMDDLGDLGEMFGSMFGFGGSRGGRTQTRKGQDIQVDLTLDFLEAVFGKTVKVKLYKQERCAVCSGSGAEPGSATSTCKTCEGKGRVQRMQRTMLGSFQTATVCPDCEGAGSRPEKRCKECEGTGAIKKQTEQEISIPAGVDNGTTVRVEGGGEYPGRGGQSGDLFVVIRVKSHTRFERKGEDIYSTIQVPYSMLTLGGSVDIETVDGHGELNIPEGTPAGTVFRLKGKGVPFIRRSGRGDHYVTVQPQINKKLSREQRKTLESLRDLGL